MKAWEVSELIKVKRKAEAPDDVDFDEEPDAVEEAWRASR